MAAKETGQTSLVSVIMTTFREIANGELGKGRDSLLAQAVESILKQTYQHWELWVVADHPPQKDVERIAALMESFNDDRIHFYNLPERTGPKAAGVKPKKAGIKKAGGALLAFLDADNAWAPHFLEYSVAALDDDPSLDLVYCDTFVRLAPGKTDDLPVTILKLHESLLGEALAKLLKTIWLPYQLFGLLAGDTFIWHKPDWNGQSREKLLNKVNFIDISETVMRKDAYLAAGGFQECFNLDWRLWKDMINTGRDNFEHLNYAGLYYSTSSPDHHVGYFVLSQIEKLNLPFDMQTFLEENEAEIQTYFSEKHQG